MKPISGKPEIGETRRRDKLSHPSQSTSKNIRRRRLTLPQQGRKRARGANHFEAIRAILAGIDGRAALASLLAEDFLHKPIGMLNAPSRRVSRSCEPRARASFAASVKKSQAPKPLILSAFSTSRKNSPAALRDRAAQRTARVACARQDATCGVGAEANMLH
jgi:hypothetical protein